MESENSKSIRSSSIDAHLEIKIKDYQTARKSDTKGTYIEDSENNFNVWISASASPSGFDEDTTGWLVVRPYVTVLRGKYRPQNSAVSWTVSVVDTEGNSRFPRSFTQDLSEDITDAKYLEKSFILSKADELLPGDVLNIRCDICFHWYNVASSLAHENQAKAAERMISDMPKHDKEVAKIDPETEEPVVDYKDFVEKNKILTEVLYLAESGKVYAIYDPPALNFRHPKVWGFGTLTETFNLILDEQLNNIGTRLLRASAVIRRCVNTPMKERLEKRIELSNVDSQTFKKVMYFVVKETLPKFEFGELLKIYKFSHMYGMEVLQRNCAENIVNSLEHESDFKELKKFANFHSDDYLSELLRIHRHENDGWEADLTHAAMDDRAYCDCYI